MAQCKVPADISALLETGEYSDIKLQCGDRTFGVHKAIVCSQSEFLAKACKVPFKEAEEGVIRLPDEDPTIVEKALKFLYTSDYDYSSGGLKADEYQLNENTALDAQLMNVDVFALANKWFIPDLQALAVNKFTALANCKEFSWWSHGVLDVLRAIYVLAPHSNRSLRDGIVRLCVAHAENLPILKPEDETYKKLLAELPDAHIDILKGTLLAKQELITKVQSDNAALLRKSGDFGLERTRLETKISTFKLEDKNLKSARDAAVYCPGCGSARYAYISDRT